jgi:hypothetical protein
MDGARVREIAWVGRPHDLLAAIIARAEDEPVHFGFSSPELVVALRDISAIPTQKQCLREPGGIELRESYRGLWRYHAQQSRTQMLTDTASLVTYMRDFDYVMWPADKA